MGILDEVLGALQKPQGVVVGGLTGLGNQISRATGININQSGLQAAGLRKKRDEDEVAEVEKMFRDLDERGVDTSAFEHMRPRAQTMLSGIQEGWKGEISPGELYRQGQNVDDWHTNGNMLDKVLKPAFDIGIDPLLLAGSALPKAAGALGQGGKVAQGVGKALEGAGTVGNLSNAGIEGGRGAMAAAKAGQFARRGYQGLLASGGDPMYALSIGTAIGGGEKALTSPLARRAAERLGKKVVEEGVGPLTGRTQFGPKQGPTLPGTESGQLFDEAGFVTSPAARQGSGAANPDLLRTTNDQPDLFTAGLTDMLRNQKALPRASAIPMGPAPAGTVGTPVGRPKVTEADLLEFLRGEVQRLTGRGR